MIKPRAVYHLAGEQTALLAGGRAGAMSDMARTKDQPTNASALAAIFGAQRTERLALRRPRADDGAAMFAIHGDPATHRHKPSSASPSAPDLRAAPIWMMTTN